MDGPLPPSHAAKVRQTTMIGLARREYRSIRERGQRFIFSLGHWVYVGTLSRLADPLAFVMDKPLPGRQRRGVFRTAFEGVTLRENLEPRRPENRYVRRQKEASR